MSVVVVGCAAAVDVAATILLLSLTVAALPIAGQQVTKKGQQAAQSTINHCGRRRRIVYHS